MKKKNLIIALVTVFLWGTLFPAIKVGFSRCNIVTTGDIFLFAGIRFFACGILICIFCFSTKKYSFALLKETLPSLLLLGCFNVLLQYIFIYIGLMDSDSSKASVIQQVGMLFYICFSSLFVKDDIQNKKKIIGGILGFIGIIIINLDETGFCLQLGDIFQILASFCAVAANIIGKRVYQKIDPVISTGISQLTGGLVLLMIGRIVGGNVYLRSFGSFNIMAYICIASIVSFSLWAIVVKSGEISKAFIIKFLEPVFASLLGALVLKENIFKWQFVVAFVLIFFGVVISNSELPNRGRTS